MREGLQAYKNVGHRRVAGWIEPQILSVVEALAIEQDRRGVTGGVAEIGVHHGRFFLGMLLASSEGDRAVAIDLFDDQDRNIDGSGEGDKDAFLRHLTRYAPDADVEVRSADSSTLGGADVVEMAGGRKVRLFSVDGGHFASLVEHDMRTADDALARGGVVIGDDVFNQQWPGAVEGTLAYLDKSDDVVPFGIGFNKVLFTHREYADDYRNALIALAGRRFWRHKESEMRGHQVVVMWVTRPKDRARLVAKRVLGKA
ncbi:class I SAM-dependent methyltransferase [Microvirga sp. 0TCS3.31]